MALNAFPGLASEGLQLGQFETTEAEHHFPILLLYFPSVGFIKGQPAYYRTA